MRVSIRSRLPAVQQDIDMINRISMHSRTVYICVCDLCMKVFKFNNNTRSTGFKLSSNKCHLGECL